MDIGRRVGKKRKERGDEREIQVLMVVVIFAPVCRQPNRVMNTGA